jgi:hypothetical protein
LVSLMLASEVYRDCPEVPFPSLTADSSRADICATIPSLYWFHRHKNYFRSKRWHNQYDAITSYAHGRGYLRSELGKAYQHYCARVLQLDRQEGGFHLDERPTVKKRRRRQSETAELEDRSSSVTLSQSLPSPSATDSSSISSESYSSPGTISSLGEHSTKETEPTIITGVSTCVMRIDAASSPSCAPVACESQVRELKLEVQELRSQLALRGPASVSPRPALPEVSKYAPYHDDTKLMEGVYTLFRQQCGSLHGADVDIANIPEKRARGAATKQPGPNCSDSVSTGYAECTLDSFDKICRLLEETIEPVDLRMGPDSVFLDIGSGYGKCVLHARFRVNVRKSVGIEYVGTRHASALEMLERHVPQRSPVVCARLRAEETIVLLQGDATSGAFTDVIDEATHIFMFDVVFSAMGKEAMLSLLARRQFRVLVCCQPPHAVEALSLRLLSKPRLRTSAQSFVCYVYTPR